MLVIFCLDLPCNGGLRLDNLLLQVKVQLHSQMLIGHHPTFGLIQPQHQKSKIEYNFKKAIFRYLTLEKYIKTKSFSNVNTNYF